MMKSDENVDDVEEKRKKRCADDKYLSRSRVRVNGSFLKC